MKKHGGEDALKNKPSSCSSKQKPKGEDTKRAEGTWAALKRKKNKGTFVENRGTSVLVCRQHGSLSEPSHSSISHLCDGAQDGLAAAVWGRQISLMFTTSPRHS